MSLIRTDGLTFTYPAADRPAVREVDFEAPAGRLTVLLGPSGSGKTTLLRLLAGLDRPGAGDIRFDARSVGHVPAERRGAAMLFQRPLLLPHMDVLDNVAFGLRARGMGVQARRQAAERMLGLVRLEGFGHRRPESLSGGQAQRVALARALVIEPAVLLLDEPLAGLEPALRGEMGELVASLQRRTATTTVLATHDLAEALAIADRLAILVDGELRQSGDPRAVYAAPADVDCAAVLGVTNVLHGIKRGDRFETAVGSLPVDPMALPDGPGAAIVRAEHIGALTPTAGADDGRAASMEPAVELEGIVRAVAFRGDAEELTVMVGGQALRVSIRRRAPFEGVGGAGPDSAHGPWWGVGATIRVVVPSAAIRLVPAPTGGGR